MTRSKPAHWYRQSAAIPVREGEGGVEVLLVTTRRSGRWIVPKGIVDPGLDPAASAAKEAWEEAGVRGPVAATPVGRYRYAKWGGTCTVDAFLLRAEETLAHWPEESVRSREWVPLEAAVRRVHDPGLRHCLQGVPEMLTHWSSDSEAE